MRSSSSVVMPGATCEPTRSRASAASLPAMRIRSMVSESLTSEPVNGAGPGLSTYSGRGMCAGTGRRAEILPGAMVVTPTSVVSSAMSDYWYCLKHHQVEHENLCNYADRLGPYPSEAEASRALEKVKERNEEWDNDPKWNDKD